MKAHAKSYELICSISFEQYKSLIENPCYYCGEKLALLQTGSGLDRINSSEGYTLENLRACCMICNQAKNVRSENEFREWVNKIYHYWISKVSL